MIATLILAAVVAPATTRLAVEPWTGTNLPTATQAAVKYRLSVQAAPNSTVTLRAKDLAKGWLAAFCTPKVCAPMQVEVTLPASGRAAYQFELIREDPNAPGHSGARITAGGASVTISPTP